MGAPRSRPASTTVSTVVLVAAVHALLIWVVQHSLWRSRPQKEGPNLWMLLLPETKVAPAESVTPRQGDRRRRDRRSAHERAGARRPMPPEPPPAPGTAIQDRPRIDWDRARVEAAQAAISKLTQPIRDPRFFTPEHKPGDIELPRAHVPAKSLPWQPPRFGFTQDGLPLIRLSERCVLVLLFVGCSIGKIERHDDLFQNMHTPESAGGSQ